MFATLSAILHLGNMEISDDKDGNAALGNNKHFQVVESPICAKVT
jgi:myosin heavy subunit